MVARGALGKYTPGKPSMPFYLAIVAVLVSFSLGGGYFAGTQPINQWRYFSWHPFLMTCGMVGLAGVATMTKKLGGYTNTKIHAMVAWGSLFVSFAGIYVIYNNKEINGYKHLQSSHALFGAGVVVACVGLGIAGSIFLHPDFGIDKTNKLIRTAHKFGARLVLILAWVTAFLGLFQMTTHGLTLVLYGLPLAALVPIVLL